MRRIALTQGQVALVDDADYEWLSQWEWYAMKAPRTFYARRNGPRNSKGHQTSVLMHHEIFGGEPDHINRNGLDNRRSNLRAADSSQQMWNSATGKPNRSGYRGVCRYSGRTSHKNWRAYIRVRGRQITVGWFATPLEAARARDEAAKRHHGDFAILNFPQSASKTGG